MLLRSLLLIIFSITLLAGFAHANGSSQQIVDIIAYAADHGATQNLIIMTLTYMTAQVITIRTITLNR